MKQHDIHDIKARDNTRAIRWRIKISLYLPIILLINYVMEKNLLVNVEYSPVKHTASRFSLKKNVTKKRQKE